MSVAAITSPSVSAQASYAVGAIGGAAPLVGQRSQDDLGAPGAADGKTAGRAAPVEDELDLSTAKGASSPASTGEELSPEQQEQVEKLAARDREVRAHEQAHLAAAGPYALGGPTYDFQKGPDGKNYAVGGEVQIDTSPVDGDPEATIRKAQVVRAAALAPAEPSAQDRRVAANASKMEQQAVAQLREQDSEGTDGETSEADTEPKPFASRKRSPSAPDLGRFIDLIA
ncbi:MAG: putative metalloprotease CJM1_0395 family protein [Planctomycetota bacterium]